MNCAKKLILLLVVVSTNSFELRSEYPKWNHQVNYNENQISATHYTTCDIDVDNYQDCFCELCQGSARTKNLSAEIELLRKELFIVENALSVLKDDVTAMKKPGEKGGWCIYHKFFIGSVLRGLVFRVTVFDLRWPHKPKP